MASYDGGTNRGSTNNETGEHAYGPPAWTLMFWVLLGVALIMSLWAFSPAFHQSRTDGDSRHTRALGSSPPGTSNDHDQRGAI